MPGSVVYTQAYTTAGSGTLDLSTLTEITTDSVYITGLLIGGGGAGGGNGGSGGELGGGGGSGYLTEINSLVPIPKNSILRWTVGAGGIAVFGDGGDGGASQISIDQYSVSTKGGFGGKTSDLGASPVGGDGQYGGGGGWNGASVIGTGGSSEIGKPGSNGDNGGNGAFGFAGVGGSGNDGINPSGGGGGGYLGGNGATITTAASNAGSPGAGGGGGVTTFPSTNGADGSITIFIKSA
jgi:hypothetical protein